MLFPPLDQWGAQQKQKGNRLRLFGVITKSLGRTKMNVINISVLLLGIMVVLMIVTCHSLPAHQQDSEEDFMKQQNTDPETYDSYPGFAELLKKHVRENEARDGSLHGHIVAVNEAHLEADKRFGKRKQIALASDDRGGIPIMEEIESTNEGKLDKLPFEGDIELLPEDRVMIGLQKPNRQPKSRRNVINTNTMKHRLWPNRVVHYAIGHKLAHMRPKIAAAINLFRKHTCLKFVEVSLPHRGDFIKYINGKGCGSLVGRKGGRQKVSLGSGCGYVGVIMHETMHALGIWHEQSRPDRDRYVEILWDNIDPKFVQNFKKYTDGSLDALGLNYDYRSIMHYDRFLFGKRPGLYTIIAKGRPWRRLGGQRDGIFTSNDIKEINTLYNCPKGKR